MIVDFNVQRGSEIIIDELLYIQHVLLIAQDWLI